MLKIFLDDGQGGKRLTDFGLALMAVAVAGLMIAVVRRVK